MSLARYQSRTGRRRPTAFLLAVAAHLLLIWLLLGIGPALVTLPKPPPPPTTFSMLPDATEQAAKPVPKPRETTAHARTSAAAVAPPRSPPSVPPPIVPPPPQAKPRPPETTSLFGDTSLFDASDISKMSHGDAGEGHDSGKDSAAVYGPGEGSGGQQLFNAEWYREPTRAEMATYLPPNLPVGSWAALACKTVEHYHVENCRSIGEEPLGSGLGRALRLASWQFLVIPPRRGGKPMIGAPVRIIYHIVGAKPADD